MMNELPTIGSSAYATSTVALDSFNTGQQLDWHGVVDHALRPRRVQLGPDVNFHPAVFNHNKENALANPARRLVQVFIADPNENVPLDKALLYSGTQKLTDLTDQELFFEIDIKSILEAHNAERVKIVD